MYPSDLSDVQRHRLETLIREHDPSQAVGGVRARMTYAG